MRPPEAVLRRLVRDARVARLGTIDPDGRPNLVPICFALDGDVLYNEVDDKPKVTKRLRRAANLERDPRCMILVDHYEEDWPAVWWVRLRGEGRVVEEGPERERAWGLLVEKYEQYRADPPEGEVIAIRIVEWRGWSYSPIE